jgi:hypothetical protein
MNLNQNMKTQKQIASALPGSLFAIVLLAAQVGRAQQDVAVSTGYNDEPRNGISYSPASGQPNPWYGSPNTTFYGNASTAQAYDPDEDAILLQNLGGSAVSLTAASMGIYNLFSLDSIGGPVTLNPGQNVILAGVDGSDTFSGLQNVALTIGGVNYSYSDVSTAAAPDGVLDGANPWIGGAESMPWTPIYTPNLGVPDSGPGLTLMAATLLGVCGFAHKLRRRFVA